MTQLKYLYTVTGQREPFYAVVDLDTGRAWTSPTKDGAMRQARDAGIIDFLERTITRTQFLNSLGIEDDPSLHTAHRSVFHQPAAEVEKPKASGWFIGGGDGSEVDSLPADFAIPARTGKKKPAKHGSPFAAQPIALPTGEIISAPEDQLIIPSDRNALPASTPFTDVPPPLAGDFDL